MSRQQESLRRGRERRQARDQRGDDRPLGAELAACAGLAAQPSGPPPTRADDPAAVDTGVGTDPNAAALVSGRRAPGPQLACGWCSQPLLVRSTGRIPKWCSATCRHRAWEQNRAAASGQAAIELVDRYIAAVPTDEPGWVTQLGELTRQIAHDRGQITAADLAQLAAALELAQAAATDRTR